MRCLVGHRFTQAQSIAEHLGDEPMLGLPTEPQQRAREAARFVAVTIPQYNANLAQLEGIVRDAPSASLGLRSEAMAWSIAGSFQEAIDRDNDEQKADEARADRGARQSAARRLTR